jgi:hypothetical protein
MSSRLYRQRRQCAVFLAFAGCLAALGGCDNGITAPNNGPINIPVSPVLTTLTLAPQHPTVALNTVDTITVTGYDQFGAKAFPGSMTWVLTSRGGGLRCKSSLLV